MLLTIFFYYYVNNLNNFKFTDRIILFCIDHEQRKLYEAAKIIQSFYRQYKDKRQQSQQRNKEIQAASLIQGYYRRYKQVELSYFHHLLELSNCYGNVYMVICSLPTSH